MQTGTFDWKFTGKTLTFSPITIGDMAAFRDHLRNKKLAEARAQLDGLPEKGAALKEIINRPLMEAEVSLALSTPDTMIFLLHRSASKKHPDLTRENIGEMITIKSLKEIMPLFNSLIGIEEGKNADPQEPPKAAA